MIRTRAVLYCGIASFAHALGIMYEINYYPTEVQINRSPNNNLRGLGRLIVACRLQHFLTISTKY